MIRLIATDLDGTLLEPNGQLPDGTFEVIEELARLGIRFAAASGRQYGNLLRLFAPVAEHMAFVCENGALTIVNGQVAGVVPIPGEMADAIIRHYEMLGLNVLVSGQHTCYMLDQNRKYTDDITYRLRNTVTILSSWQEISEPILKVSCQCDGGIMTFAPELLEKWGNQLTSTVSGRDWFDCTVANKGTGMAMLMRHTGITPEETVAFGDQFNDETMLDQVGYPFLMHHADQRLHKPAYRLCDKVLPVLRAIVLAGGDPRKAFNHL